PIAMTETAADLAKLGIGIIDAPVSGGAAGAKNGTLAIMVAGASSERDHIRPFLEAVSTKVFVVGDQPGDAQTMKLVNNLLAAANRATAYEALALGVKLGLKPEKMVEVFRSSTGNNTGLDERKVEPILSGRFSGLGAISNLEKDIQLAFEVARRA